LSRAGEGDDASMTILWIVIIVLIVLFILGYFGRGRMGR
jgi:flagellar basal body-associated protein FliL